MIICSLNNKMNPAAMSWNIPNAVGGDEDYYFPTGAEICSKKYKNSGSTGCTHGSYSKSPTGNIRSY
jgi:hypothetical protein